MPLAIESKQKEELYEKWTHVMQSNEANIDMACHLGANQHTDDKADVDKTIKRHATQYER